MFQRTILLAAIIAVSPVILAQERTASQRPLAHIVHNDVSFSVSIDPTETTALLLVVPERINTVRRPVKVSIRFRDESKTEAVLQPLPSFGSGGFADYRYRFDAKRAITEANLFSVTVSVGSDSFEAFPW